MADQPATDFWIPRRADVRYVVTAMIDLLRRIGASVVAKT
jgi:hypothetical protein